MDAGAHFFQCDFQVHSPRDAGWAGKDAVTNAERNAYSEELILACRKKNLDAIAITDHHDFAFFPFVRAAAKAELDDSGEAVAAERQIVVYPGIEVTLTAPACQVLIILDSDFPENLLQSVLTALSINAAASGESKCARTERIPQNVVSDLTALYERLNSHDHIRGRFIVLPNVTETGHGTLLRSGFGNFYKSMPCVGGYTDGPVTKFGTGNREILDGKNRDYGFKSVGVFQTSDNRRRDHATLGKHTTWVKWSIPTAEALRQACLAKESRLSLTEPELPTLWIKSVSVSHSKYLGRVNLEFNAQYNAVIGGRGTGKSTLLEYLRWGLCDQAVDQSDSDIAPVQIKRKKLIDDTLQKFDGEVVVVFVLNGVEHTVKRSSKTQEIFLKIGNAGFQPTVEHEIRNLFPAQAYSQKQLSSVGVRVEELKRFVELPIRQRLDQIRAEIRDVEAKIRNAYSSLARKREIERETAKYGVETASLETQVATLRKSLKGLLPEDEKLIAQKPLYDNEEIILESLKERLNQIEENVSDLANAVDLEVESEDDDAVNEDLIEKIKRSYGDKFEEIEKTIQGLSALFKPGALKGITDETKKWEKLKAEFDRKYEAAKQKAGANQQLLEQIKNVEKRLGEIKRLLMEQRKALSSLGDPEKAHLAQKNKWLELHKNKIVMLSEQCEKFTVLSNGLISASVEKSLDVDALKQKLKTAFASLNIREQKIEQMCGRILDSSDSIQAWTGTLAELEIVALHDDGGTTPLSVTPILDACGFTSGDKARLASSFDWPRWLELSVLELEFNPVFLYCTNLKTGEHISFIDASAGQQATALLTVLLNQKGAPLIIDQPEDDIDSKMATDIVSQIWKAKSQRQLIFASHNANFVVNGDAELVICCDYVRAGDQTGGQIKLVGAIDKTEIRDEITSVTEGGKAAFKLRKEKYGF